MWNYANNLSLNYHLLGLTSIDDFCLNLLLLWCFQNGRNFVKPVLFWNVLIGWHYKIKNFSPTYSLLYITIFIQWVTFWCFLFWYSNYPRFGPGSQLKIVCPFTCFHDSLIIFLLSSMIICFRLISKYCFLSTNL